jgi:hypothetical protein
MARGPRFFLNAFIIRPTVLPAGDLDFSAPEAPTRASIWDKRTKPVIAGQGELATVTAVGYFPTTTDIRIRDRVRTADGRRYEVLRVIPGISDRGQLSHYSAELRSVGR